MKTSFFHFLPMALCLLAVQLLSASDSYGQSIRIKGFVGGHLGTMDIEMSGMNEKPSMVILVFDSVTCTYDIADCGQIKFIACNVTTSSGSSGGFRESGEQKKLTQIEVHSDEHTSDLLHEEVDFEPEMDLKEWMMNPSEWIEDQREL